MERTVSSVYLKLLQQNAWKAGNVNGMFLKEANKGYTNTHCDKTSFCVPNKFIWKYYIFQTRCMENFFWIHFLYLDNFCISIHLCIWIHCLYLDIFSFTYLDTFSVFGPKIGIIHFVFQCNSVFQSNYILMQIQYRDNVLLSKFFSSRRCQDQMEICHQATFADLQFFACQSLYGSRNLWR